MESGATIPDWSGKKWVPTSYQTGLVRRLYFSYQTGLVRSKYSLLTRLVDLEKNVCIMNLVEKVQPSYQTGLVSNEYLLLTRPVWYEVRAYFLPDWSGKKVVPFLPDSYFWQTNQPVKYTGCPKKRGNKETRPKINSSNKRFFFSIKKFWEFVYSYSLWEYNWHLHLTFYTL